MPEPLSPFRRLVIAEPGTARIEVRCTMREAARLIAGGQWNAGIPGGSFIDAEVRRVRSRAS